MNPGADPEGAAEGTFGRALSQPWWESAGRLALGLWLVPIGLTMVAGSGFRLVTDGRGPLLPIVATALLGAATLTAGILGLEGRLRAAGYLLGFMLAAALLELLFPSKAGETGSAAYEGKHTAEILLPASALAWIVVRSFAERGRFRAAMKVAAGTLLGVYAVCLPTQGRTLGAAVGMLTWDRGGARPIEVGLRFPAGHFAALDGSEFALDEPGVLYVVNFWATWCAPCLEELPHLKEMAGEWAPSAPIRLIAVNTEDLDGDFLSDWLERENLRGLPVVRDPHGIQEAVGAVRIPFTLLVRDRIVLGRHQGFGADTVACLKSEIRDLLSERLGNETRQRASPGARTSR